MVDAHTGLLENDNSSTMRWSVALAAALMNGVQAGAFFMTPTTLMSAIAADFGLKPSLSTVAIALGKISYVLLLVPGGILVDYFGPRRCVLIGLVGMAILLSFYSTLVKSFSGLLILHALLATSACISGVPVYSLFIAQWFQSNIGLAMGLVLAGYSAAGTLVPAFLGPIASQFGWHVAMGCMACVLWLVGLPIAFFFLRENHDQIERRPLWRRPTQSSLPSTSQDSLTSRTVLNDNVPLLTPDGVYEESFQTTHWIFAGFALSYILLQYSFGCFAENIIFFLHTDCNMSLAIASLYFSALNFSSFLAKLVGGYIGDRLDRFLVAAATSGLAGVGASVLFCTEKGIDEHSRPYLTDSNITILMFVVLFGIGYGATFNSLYALVPIVFGRTNLAIKQSTLFGLGLAGNAIGSVLTGVLREKYGTYQIPFLVSTIMCMANFFTLNITRAVWKRKLQNANCVLVRSPR